LKIALCSLNGIAESSGEPYETAVFFEPNSCVCTNGSVIAEYWHGLGWYEFKKLTDVLIPKQAIGALSKTDKGLVKCGLSEQSITFHFEDGSFIKTQLIKEPFPPYAHLFEKKVNPWPISEDFFKAVRSIEPFAKEGVVYFVDGGLASSQSGETFYKIEGLPKDWSFNIKHLLSVEHLVKTIHFDVDSNKAIFFGENCRGIVMGMEKQTSNKVNE